MQQIFSGIFYPANTVDILDLEVLPIPILSNIYYAVNLFFTFTELTSINYSSDS